MLYPPHIPHFERPDEGWEDAKRPLPKEGPFGRGRPGRAPPGVASDAARDARRGGSQMARAYERCGMRP